MTPSKRMRIAALAMICLTAAATSSVAATAPQALSPADAQTYAAAFDAVDRGDFIEAELQTAQIQDKSLLGHLSFRRLMQPGAYKASFDDLKAWLSKYADLPEAERVFSLANRRKPVGEALPAAPMLVRVAAEPAPRKTPVSRAEAARRHEARDAFYSGDPRRALELAPAVGDRWIAGLSAYRLKNYALAESYFEQVANDEAEDAWLRAAGAYWAARAAGEQGEAARAGAYLRAAARAPDTFYGMIAERQIGLRPVQTARAEDQSAFVLAAYAPVAPTGVDLSGFLKSEPRAHRAAALAQIGKLSDAGRELRAGLALSRTEAERARWLTLVSALNAEVASDGPSALVRPVSDIDYPTPALEPISGFTIDKALVYAIVRQESRFNPAVVSPAGAVGLMQLMPDAAARAAGDDKLKSDMSPLFDPAFNLRVGQDYVTWLMERGVGYDILRTVAAYNGGPGTLLKTARMLGDDADSLMIIECLPAQETRNYVEKVMTAYWTYRRQFGQESQTLDALATGAKFIDARLDRPLTQP